MIWVVIEKIFRTLRELSMELIGKLTLVALIIFGFTIGIIYFRGYLSSEDQFSYCYIVSTDNRYTFAIEGVRKWRQNKTLGYGSSYTEALELMSNTPVCQK